MKCSMILRWCGDWPTRGLMMCESSLATPYVMDPLLETMGLRGCLFYGFWAGHRTWGDCTGGIKLFVFWGGKASSLFTVFEKSNEFVFEMGDGVFRENFINVGILK